MNQNKLAVMPIPKLVANISLPLMISLLVQSMYNIVDGMFVARISETALTATSLAFPIQLLMIAVAVGTGVGINSLLSRTLGQREMGKVNQIAENGIFLAVCSSVVTVLLGLVGTRAFLRVFTQDEELLEMGTQYLRICMVVSIGIFLATTGERLLQATGNTFLSMVAQVSGALTNIILDPILIFGLLGMPALGITGAAIATVVGQCVAAAVALYLNHTRNPEIRISFRGFRPDGSIIRGIYAVGIPTMFVQGMNSMMLLGMNRILIVFSDTAVALFGIYYKLQTFVFMPVNGLAQGLIPIVGFNFGAKNGRRAVDAFRITLLAAVVIMLFGTLVFWTATEPLLRLYDANAEMLRLGVPALRILSLTFVLMGITLTIGYTFSGMGNGMVNMICAVLRQILLLLPLSYLFSSLFGVEYTWYAMCIADSAAVAVALAWFARAYRRILRPMIHDGQ